MKEKQGVWVFCSFHFGWLVCLGVILFCFVCGDLYPRVQCHRIA